MAPLPALPAAADSPVPENGPSSSPDLSRAAAAPPWAEGSSWTWAVDQQILFSEPYGGFDVVVDHVAGSITDALVELTTYNGTPSYRVEGGYSLTLSGNYSSGPVKVPFSWPVNGNGTTYYRIPDLATVRELMHISADMGAIGSTTFDSTADASPPAENFRFPLDVASSWSVSTSYATWEKTTGALGSTEYGNVTRMEYAADVLRVEHIDVPAGTLACYNITYEGTSSTDGQSPRPYNDSAPYCDAATNLALRRFSPLANLTVVFGLSGYSLNHAPSVVSALPAVSFEEGTTGSLDLSAIFSDPDAGDSLDFAATNYTRLAVTVSGGMARFAAETGWSGTETVVLSATDRKGARALAPIEVTVTPASGDRNPPVATCSTHEYRIAHGLALYLDLSERFMDPDTAGGDTLAFSVEGLPANFTVSLDSRTGSLTITPPADFSGTARFGARATDSTNLSANETIGLTVEAPDRPPVLRGFFPPATGLTVPENSTQDFAVDAVDPEGKPLSTVWSLDGINSGTGQNFTFRPDFGSAGRHNLTATVSDGALSAKQGWDISVTHVNRPPVAVAITSPQDGALVKRGARINFIGEGSDPDGDSLTFTWEDSDGTVLGVGRDITLSNLTKGNHLITLDVSDGAETVNATALVTVSAPAAASTPGFSAAGLLVLLALAMLASGLRRRCPGPPASRI